MVKNTQALNKLWAENETLVTVTSAEGGLTTFTCAPGKLTMIAPGIISGSGTRKANALPTVFVMDIRSANIEISDAKDKEKEYRAPLFASEKAFYAEYHAQFSNGNGNGKAKAEAPVKPVAPKKPRKPKAPPKKKSAEELTHEVMVLLNDNLYDGELNDDEMAVWVIAAQENGVDTTDYDAMAKFIHES